MTSQSLLKTVAAALLLSVIATPVRAAEWLIVVGVNRFDNATDLQFCARDAQSLVRVAGSLGFIRERIRALHDGPGADARPTRDNILQAVNQVLSQAAKDDVVVFAASTHGVSVGGRSYLCPPRADLGRPDESMIAVDELYDRFIQAGAKNKLLLIDACRNEHRSKRRNIERAKARTEPSQWLEATQGFDIRVRPPADQNILLLTSCSPGEYSWEDSQLEHGVFMHYLIQGLRGEAASSQSHLIGIVDLFTFARDKTREHVQRVFGAQQSGRIISDGSGFPLGPYTTMMYEDFRDTPMGDIPTGWTASDNVLVQKDGDGPYLWANGRGAAARTPRLSIHGDFELDAEFTCRNSANWYLRLHSTKFDLGETRDLVVNPYFYSSGNRGKLSVGHWTKNHSTPKFLQTRDMSGEELQPGRFLVRIKVIREGRIYRIYMNDQDDPLYLRESSIPSFNAVSVDLGRQVLRRISLRPLIR